MAFQIVSILIAALLAALIAWAAVRAWGSERAVVRWPGSIAGGLLALVLVVVTVVASVGFVRVHHARGVPAAAAAPATQAQASAAQVDRGQNLAHICSGCHSADKTLPLSGGDENMASPFGRLYAPNLTPAGPLQSWSDAEVARAIRDGVDNHGRPLMIMPSSQFHRLSDNDVAAIVAYLRSQPAIAHQKPAPRVNLLGLLIIGAGLFPTSAQPALTTPVPDPPAGINPDHGRYLVTISDCTACHGDNLTGGTSPFAPKGPNIRALVPTWTPQQFVQTIRSGTDPSGHQLNPDNMPWQDFSAAYSDEELQAIFAYLKSLPPVK